MIAEYLKPTYCKSIQLTVCYKQPRFKEEIDRELDRLYTIQEDLTLDVITLAKLLGVNYDELRDGTPKYSDDEANYKDKSEDRVVL